MGTRNRVRFEPGERMDLGDVTALQLNARTAIRRALKQLLFGNTNRFGNATSAVQGLWTITPTGSQLTVVPARAWAGEELADGSVEPGEGVGEDGDISQTLDLAGEPAGTYYLWVRAAYDPSATQSRIFWDAAAEEETPRSLETREAAGWKVSYTNSATPPGANFVLIGTTAFDGGTGHTVAYAYVDLFEGNLTGAGAAHGAHAWGGGANDRSTNRGLYGVRSLIDFAAAVRRQIGDIIEDGGGWWAAVPTSTRLGVKATLKVIRDHLDLSTDPHGANLTQTGTFTAGGKATMNAELEANGILDVNGAADFADTADFHDDVDFADNIHFPTALNTAALPEFGSRTIVGYSTDADGYRTVRTLAAINGLLAGNGGPYSPVDPDEIIIGGDGQYVYGVQTNMGGAGSSIYLYFDLTNLFASSAHSTSGTYLEDIVILLAKNGSPVGTLATWTLTKRSVWSLVGGPVFLGPGSKTVTTISSGSAVDTDFSGTNLTAIAVDLSAAPDRTMNAPESWILEVRLYSRADGGAVAQNTLSCYGIAVSGKERYLHP